MPSKDSIQLVERLLSTYDKQFETTAEYLAWRSGFLASVLATLADEDSLVKSAIIAYINKKNGPRA